MGKLIENIQDARQRFRNLNYRTYTVILQFLLSLMNSCACTSAALAPSAETGVVARVLARNASAVSKMVSFTRWVMTKAPGGSKLLMVDWVVALLLGTSAVTAGVDLHHTNASKQVTIRFMLQ